MLSILKYKATVNLSQTIKSSDSPTGLQNILKGKMLQIQATKLVTRLVNEALTLCRAILKFENHCSRAAVFKLFHSWNPSTRSLIFT